MKVTARREFSAANQAATLLQRLNETGTGLKKARHFNLVHFGNILQFIFCNCN